MEDDSDLIDTDELVNQLVQAIERRIANAPPPPILEPEPLSFEPTSENEEILYEMLRAAVAEIETLTRRINTLEELILLQYRSKDSLSH